MKPNILKTTSTEAVVLRPLSEEDSIKIAAQRAAAAPMKGKLGDIAAREPFNNMMEQVMAPKGVTFENATVGGLSGWWARPIKAQEGAAIIHMHGGWFSFGTAKAFRNLAGHIALSAGADTFIPDYSLAPEHPFPAAIEDLEACFVGMVEKGIKRIALTGDSAGGNLALVLLAIASAQASKIGVTPAGAVVFSPITDLTLSGETYNTRAEADPYFTKFQAAGLLRSYLGKMDPKNPLASPIYGDLNDLPPIRVHVGDDEILLDDSRQYVERAVAAGVDAKLEVWMGMPHGFINDMGHLDAAMRAMNSVGTFLTKRIGLTLQHDHS